MKRPQVSRQLFAVSSLMLCALVAVACRGGGTRGGDDPYAFIADCPKYERILASGRSISDKDPAVRDAYESIRFCSDPIGGLARAWGNPPTDTFTLMILRVRSADLADQRMLALVLPVATDTLRAPLVRWAAMGTLVELSNPCRELTERTWSRPEGTSLATKSHCDDEPGAQPITAADRDRILALFRQMAASDPDARVRAVSKTVAFELTPPPPPPPLASRFSWTHLNEKPAPVEFPPGSGTMLTAGFVELGDSTAAPRRFTISFTFRAKPSDSAQTRSHGGTFRVVRDSLLFTNDGQEGQPPVRFRYWWRMKDLVLVDAQNNRWSYTR